MKFPIRTVKKAPHYQQIQLVALQPNKWWTIFSAFCLFAYSHHTYRIDNNARQKRLWGRGGIELLIGIIIPLLFILLTCCLSDYNKTDTHIVLKVLLFYISIPMPLLLILLFFGLISYCIKRICFITASNPLERVETNAL